MSLKALQNVGKVAAPQDDITCTPISFKEVQQWVLQLPVDPDRLQPMREEVVEDTRCMCMSRKRMMCDVPGLDRKLWREKDLVLFMKTVDFDFNETAHYRMLRTMYIKLSRNKVCGSIGRHWEVLGFQHTDPRTDLNRSGGILNVLQLFYLFAHHFEILKAAYLLAQDDEQNFPLACVSINITRFVMEALLNGKLSGLCNSSEKGVFDTICKVYSGGMFHFYHQWRSQKRTIRHTEETFNEVRALLDKRPAKLLDGLAKGLEEHKAKNDPSRFQFTDLDFSGRQEGARAAPTPTRANVSVPRRLMNYRDQDDA